MGPISSTQNQGIKDALKLSKAKFRRESGLFTIEGERELSRAYKHSYQFEKIYFCKNLLNDRSKKLLQIISCENKTEVKDHVFSRIAYRDNSDGLFAVARSKKHSLDILINKKNPLYLVIETVEKPGNLGALLRTADGAGLDGVIVCDNSTDLYNPNIIRSSLGCLFTQTIALCDSKSCIAFLRDHKINIYSAALQNSTLYTEADMKKPSAIIMGSESNGLSEIWRKEADKIIAIPMNGEVDSLNVSVSAAILIYEALRQRTLIQ